MHRDLVLLYKGLLFFAELLLTLDKCIRTDELASANLLDVDGVGALKTQTASANHHIVIEK